MPSNPPTIFVPPSPGAPPSSPGAIFVPPSPGSVSDPAAIDPGNAPDEPASILVMGAGESMVNGWYRWRGDFNEVKTVWVQIGGDCEIYWEGNQWIIHVPEARGYYYADSTAMFPDLAEEWDILDDGSNPPADAPAPRVLSSGRRPILTLPPEIVGDWTPPVVADPPSIFDPS